MTTERQTNRLWVIGKRAISCALAMASLVVAGELPAAAQQMSYGPQPYGQMMPRYTGPAPRRGMPAPRSALDIVPEWQRGPQQDAPYWAQPVARRAPGPAQPFAEDEIVAQGPPQNGMPQAPAPQSAVAPQQRMQRGEPVQPPPADEMHIDAMPFDGQGGDFAGPFDPSGPCCDSCGTCHDGNCDPMACERFHPCSFLSFLNEFAVFAGPQAFKGPIDQGANGNFGLHEGLSVGDVLWHRHGLGYQLGVNYTEADLNGNQVAGAVQNSARRQTFVTAGLFHRAYYNQGLQGGVVVDYLNDNYYVNANLTQLRAEISYINPWGHEFGFWSAASSRTNTVTYADPFGGVNTRSVRALNMNNFFYRKNLRNGGQGRLWGGFTGPYYGNGTKSITSAIFGGDFRVPVSNRFDLIGGFNYIAPGTGTANTGNTGGAAEGWGMTMSVVFYPGRCATGLHNGPYRPLFDVANNTNFLIDSQP